MRARSRRGAAVVVCLALTVLLAGCHDMSAEWAAYSASKSAESAAAASATTAAGDGTPAPNGSAHPEPPAEQSTPTVPEPTAPEPTPPEPTPPAPTPEPPASGPRQVDVQVSTLTMSGADEASGLTASVRSPGAFYLVNDASGTGEILAVGADGALLARIAVDGMNAGNAEALASGACGATPTGAGTALPPSARCLYVGDIGDQVGRPRIVIYRLREPATDGSDESVPADAWSYTYPDGPQNAEALLVDAAGTPLVITKPDRVNGAVAPARIYRAPAGGGTLEFVREFRPPDPPIALQSLVTGNVVTDAASSPGRVLLLTYDQLLDYQAPAENADLASFPDWPAVNLTMPALMQAEGVTGTLDGCGYAVASEAGPAGRNGRLAVATCR